MKSAISSRLRRSGGAAKGGGTTVFLVDANGGCSPATEDALTLAFKGKRTDETRRRAERRKEKAAELQAAREDRAAVRRILEELEREARVVILPKVRIRVTPPPVAPEPTPTLRRSAPRRTSAIEMPGSSWLIDNQGMRGVQYSQTYLGRKSEGFYVGCAREAFRYAVRDEAVLRDELGQPRIFGNLGETIDEVDEAWDVIERTSTRANAKIVVRIILPLDADASLEEQIDALRRFTGHLEALGLGYTAVIHDAPDEGDARNRHAHTLVHFREVERVAPYEWAIGREVRAELDGAEGIATGRSLWAHAMTEAAEASGRNMIYTGRSYANRCMEDRAGQHLGPALTAVLRRGGRVPQAERNAFFKAQNDLRRKARDAEAKIAALKRIGAAMEGKAERPAGWQAGRSQNVPRTAYRPASKSANKSAPRFQPAGQSASVDRPIGAYASAGADDRARTSRRWALPRAAAKISPGRWAAPAVSKPSSQPLAFPTAKSAPETVGAARYGADVGRAEPLPAWNSGQSKRFVRPPFDPALSLDIATIEREAIALEARKASEAEAARAATTAAPVASPEFSANASGDLDRVFREAIEGRVRKRANDLALARRLFLQVPGIGPDEERLLELLSEAHRRRAVMQPLLDAAWNEADDDHIRAEAKTILATAPRAQLRDLPPALRQTLEQWGASGHGSGQKREGPQR